MIDLWEVVPGEDWKIASILQLAYQPVFHHGTPCPTPEACGRYHHKLPWSESDQAKIDEIKKLRLARNASSPGESASAA